MFYFTRISERQKKFYNADADADVNANNADAEMSMPKCRCRDFQMAVLEGKKSSFL